MKKIALLACLFVLALSLSACGSNTAPPSSDTQSESQSASKAKDVTNNDVESKPVVNPVIEEITDTEARELYMKAIDEIILLATEDPITVIKNILGDHVTVVYEDRNIDDKVYYETSAQYREMQDYYSNLFSGDALSWILSTKFTSVEGTLYCSPVGGASGWGITNLEVTRTSQNNDTYIYKATFREFEETTTSSFEIKNTEHGYRITSIDYIPDLLKKQ